MRKRIVSVFCVFVLLISMVITGIPPTKVYAANNQNLALNKPTFDSDHEVDYVSSKYAVDGNHNTKWSSAPGWMNPNADNSWWYVDLGAVSELDQVVIHWGDAPGAKWKLLISNDGKTWENAFKDNRVLDSKDYSEKEEVIKLDKSQARFVKFQGIERTPVRGQLFGYAFYEFEVYGYSKINEIVNSITSIPDLTADSNKITLPEVPEGYKISLFGSDKLPVIDLGGKIHKPLVDTPVNLLFKVEDKENPSIYGITKNIAVNVPGQYKSNESANPEPKVIPSLREWFGHEGQFKLTDSSRIVVNPSYKNELQTAAEETAKDLKEVNGFQLNVVYGTPVKGDLYLTLDKDLSYLTQGGYIFDVNDYITITSAQVDGVFYGTRTALQILKQNQTTIPKGISRDYPANEERGFMLDVARKFYTIDFLRDYVKLLSWYKMSNFQIHLNDDVWSPFADGTTFAFRLESERFPGLASPEHYTKEEFRSLQQLGMNYGVNIIPEFDTPGHSGAFINYDKELANGHGGMDVTKQKTIQFVEGLFSEYIDGPNPTFIGPDVHIGTDEYHTPTQKDVEDFRAYMDHLIKFINAKGKHPLIWGGLTEYKGTTPVDTNTTMNVWSTGFSKPEEMIDQGYNIINTDDANLYIVPKAGYYHDYLDGKNLYENWEANKFHDSTLPYGHPQLKGAMFALWNDVSYPKGITMADSHDRILPAVQVLAEKMWNGSETKQDFTKFSSLASVIGEAPNTSLSHHINTNNKDGNIIQYTFDDNLQDTSGNNYHGSPKNTEFTEGKMNKGLKLKGGSSYVETGLKNQGFGWTTSFWIKPDQDNPENAILLDSKNSQLKISKNKIVLSSENYSQEFNYKLPYDQWTNILLKGDNTKTTLYINGNEYTEQKQTTFVLPLEKIGSLSNAFKGSIDNLRINNRTINILGDVNYTLNKQAYARDSEVDWVGPEFAVDGKSGTKWASDYQRPDADSTWWSVDLGEEKEISKVSIQWETAYAETYKILVSNDNKNWVNVLPNDGVFHGKEGLQESTFDPIKARYVKFQGIKRATGWGYCFFEFEVYGKTNDYGKYKALVEDGLQLYHLDRGDDAIRAEVMTLLTTYPYEFDSNVPSLMNKLEQLRQSIPVQDEKNKKDLQETIELAESIYKGGVIGNKAGQFNEADKAVFGSSIEEAKKIYAQLPLTNEAVQKAISSLNKAISEFKSKIIADKQEKLQVLKSDEFGKYLADMSGITLYYSSKDTPDFSHCTDECLAEWQPFYQETIKTTDGYKAKDFGTLTRKDGQKQTTYKGYPLYYYQKDYLPGDTKGHGLNNTWFVVNKDLP